MKFVLYFVYMNSGIMNYYFEFDRFLSHININNDVTLLIYNYSFVKCVDCNDMYVDEFYECKCGKFRCEHHTYSKTIYINKKLYCNDCYDFSTNINKHFVSFFPSIKCIIGNNKCKPATYGCKDRIYYCEYHRYYRKCILYSDKYRCDIITCINIACDRYCHIHSRKPWYYDKTISICNEKGKICCFCKKIYLNIKYCKCSNYCNYCLAMCTWWEEEYIVCNICANHNNDMSPFNSENIDLLCYYENCERMAEYGYYGIPLCCKNHLININHSISQLCQVPMYAYCKIDNCYKLCVDHNEKCYDHTTEKNRKIIKYIISEKN